MAISISPLPESTIPSAPKRNLDPQFGRVVEGIDLANLSDSELSSIQELLYAHSVLVFPNTKLSSEKQYQLTKSFDPTSENYGHKGRQKQSILHPDLKTIPDVPQVQLIGNGLVKEHEGLVDARLKHPHHKTFHKTVVSEQDEKAGKTRFYRWHIDAALYELSPPRVTSLYALQVPKGEPQICVYDDGTGEELAVPLGTTAFISGKDMFESLSDEDKSLAVRCTAVYSPHPYVWMSKARSNSCGLGLESEGLELEKKDLPEYEESKIKELPMLWKNPVTGALHFQVHPSAVSALKIAPLPSGNSKLTSAPYPNGATLTDLKEVRALVYRLQRPAIAPSKIYAHDWKEGDMALFHNQGVLHSVVGAFEPEEVRMFHQCNLAASCDPKGPDAADLERYA